MTHDSEQEPASDEATNGDSEPAYPESEANEIALDDPAVRLLGNAKTVLWDIPEKNIDHREQKRLQTILKKTDELEEIVRNRKRDEIMTNTEEDD